MTCCLCGVETTELATHLQAPLCEDMASSCPTCTAVAKVQEEINQVVATLRRLLEKRSDLRSERNRAHDPMHRLPLELRNYIFELVQPEQDEWGDNLRAEGVIPSYLSSICRGWRDTAWENPSLWSTIRVAPGKMTTPSCLDFVHNRILRSRTLPLTLCIEMVDHRWGNLDWSTEVLDPVLESVSQCSDRVQSLCLIIDLPLSPFPAFQHSKFQWHRLTRLQIMTSLEDTIDQHFSLLNPTASPERIELYFLSFKSLQISWNRLSHATVQCFNLEDLTQLFQHASQMTDCHVYSLRSGPENFAMPSVIHHRLKTLNLRCMRDEAIPIMRLDSLTLPCLQEFHTNEMVFLMDLPALLHRSACPLTRLTLLHDVEDELALFDNLQPLYGMNDVVLETLSSESAVIKKFLLGGYFPDLRRLTLRLEPFLFLWTMGVISLLLDCNQFRPDGPNEGRISRLFVVEEREGTELVWDLGDKEQLKMLFVRLTEDGFDFS